MKSCLFTRGQQLFLKNVNYGVTKLNVPHSDMRRRSMLNNNNSNNRIPFCSHTHIIWFKPGWNRKSGILCSLRPFSGLFDRHRSASLGRQSEVWAATCDHTHTLINKSPPRYRYDSISPLDTVTALISLPASLIAKWAHKSTSSDVDDVVSVDTGGVWWKGLRVSDTTVKKKRNQKCIIICTTDTFHNNEECQYVYIKSELAMHILDTFI